MKTFDGLFEELQAKAAARTPGSGTVAALDRGVHSIGKKGEPPVIPLNIVGDFAGGGMLLAIGMLSAIIEAMRSGCRFVRITTAGLTESHVHDVQITRAAPNYRQNM